MTKYRLIKNKKGEYTYLEELVPGKWWVSMPPSPEERVRRVLKEDMSWDRAFKEYEVLEEFNTNEDGK